MANKFPSLFEYGRDVFESRHLLEEMLESKCGCQGSGLIFMPWLVLWIVSSNSYRADGGGRPSLINNQSRFAQLGLQRSDVGEGGAESF